MLTTKKFDLGLLIISFPFNMFGFYHLIVILMILLAVAGKFQCLQSDTDPELD